MLKIHIIAVGKLKERAFTELEAEFLKRASGLSKIKLTELPEEPYRKEKDSEKARKKESKKILSLLPQDAFVVALDEKGKLVSTESLAKALSPYSNLGREIYLILGSSNGLDEKVKKRANWLLSLSSLTFTHNFARVLLEEQIYRIATLLSGKIYHK